MYTNTYLHHSWWQYCIIICLANFLFIVILNSLYIFKTHFFQRWKIKVKSLSLVWLFATAWNVAHQAALSMEFSRQEYWSELPFPSPEDLPNPGVEPRSPTLQILYHLSHQESPCYMYTVLQFDFIFFSFMVYCRVLNIVSCATQQDLAVFPF